MATMFALAWFCYLPIVALHAGAWAGLFNIVRSVVGIVGAIVAIAVVRSGARIAGQSMIPLGVTLLTIYLADWGLRVTEYVDADPGFGIARASWQVVIATPVAAAIKLVGNGSIALAAAEIYWTLAMPAVQAIGLIGVGVAWTGAGTKSDASSGQ